MSCFIPIRKDGATHSSPTHSCLVCKRSWRLHTQLTLSTFECLLAVGIDGYRITMSGEGAHVREVVSSQSCEAYTLCSRRSVVSDREVFAVNCYESGLMTEACIPITWSTLYFVRVLSLDGSKSIPSNQVYLIPGPTRAQACETSKALSHHIIQPSTDSGALPSSAEPCFLEVEWAVYCDWQSWLLSAFPAARCSCLSTFC